MRSASTFPASAGKHARYVGAERFCGLQVPMGIRGGRETKYRWGVQHHGISVRHHGVIAGISRRKIALHHSRHGVRHSVRQMHAGVAKSDSGVSGSQHHIGAGLVIGRIFYGAHQVSRDHAQGLQRPHITDGIRSLIRGPRQRAIRQGAIRVRQCRVGLDCVAQNVKTCRGGHLRRHGPRVLGIEQSDGGLESAAGDAGLGVHPGQVEYRYAGGLAAGTRGGGNCNQRLQRARHRQALADGRIHVVQKIFRADRWCKDSPPWPCQSWTRRRLQQSRRIRTAWQMRSHPEMIRR